MPYDFVLEHKKREKENTALKTQQKKVLLALTALLVAAAALFGVWRFTRGTVSPGAKNVTVEVIHRDASSKTFEYQTDREYLGELLKDEALADGEDGAFGMFITTVDGETADDTVQEWWCITKGGEMLNTSADQTPIADGDKYELTLTTGY